MSRFTITVTDNRSGEDVTEKYLRAPSIDANIAAAVGTGVTSLSNLAEDNALTALCQLIDTSHEWGKHDPDPLYDKAKQAIAGHVGYPAHIDTPDGYRLTVVQGSGDPDEQREVVFRATVVVEPGGGQSAREALEAYAAEHDILAAFEEER